MFPKQNIVAFIHALQLASMPFSATIGLVIFGMLTAPPRANASNFKSRTG
ncbi:hypothetical protein PCC7424_3875 [Gloeothece citriformis PCC 7424]|uniref:Uncharacterized protein n=1 Tax=Gloeothece citriformis (strain PCC 7424) TaxID=65393 RepID=B7KKC1_GLOC7|nr:hypothetical protein PCC7424_3875 [Gloeothece citriformis PCC 7424]